MAHPNAKSDPWTLRKRELATLRSSMSRPVIYAAMGDSISDMESADARYGSWHGDFQRRIDEKFASARVKALLAQIPAPAVTKGLEGFLLKNLSYENFLADYSFGPPLPSLMEPRRVSGVPSWAKQHGTGLQAAYQSAGSARDRTEWCTGMSAHVATQKKGDRYVVEMDGVVVADVTAPADGLTVRRHERGGLALAQRTMTIRFLAGTDILNMIDKMVGTENEGVHVVNMHRAGLSMNSLSAVGPGADPQQLWARWFPSLAKDQRSGVDLGHLSLGTNNVGDPEDQFEMLTQSTVEGFMEANPNAILRLSLPARPSSASVADWAGKYAAEKRVASRIENVIVDPLSDEFGEPGVRIPRITNRPDLIKGLHPKTPLYRGDNLPYGYATTLMSIVDQSIFTGAPVEETPDPDPTDPTTPADTTPPTVTVITGDNLSVNENGTFTFAADIEDVSPLGITVVRTGSGYLVGDLVKTSGTRYELTVTWADLRELLPADGTVLRWFVVAYDAFDNRAATGARTLTVALPAVPVDTAPPVVTNITATGFDIPGSAITISANITHSSGILLAPINIEGEYREDLEYTGSGTLWRATIPRESFLNGDDYQVGAMSNDKTSYFSGRIAYVLAGTKDVTAPTTRMTKPLTNLTLGDIVQLEAYAVDIESGMKKLDFYVDDALLTRGTYTSQGLYAATVPLQAILDAAPTGKRIRARAEDLQGNWVFSDPVFFTVPAPPSSGELFQPLLDGATKLPAEPAVLQAWDLRFGGASSGSTGISLTTNAAGDTILTIAEGSTAARLTTNANGDTVLTVTGA